jgi:hypothetical protein
VLVACRLAGLSALEDYAGVRVRAQFGADTVVLGCCGRGGTRTHAVELAEMLALALAVY